MSKNKSIVRDLEKQRAEFAYKCVDEMVKDCKNFKEEDIEKFFDKWVDFLGKEKSDIKDKSKFLKSILNCDNYKSYVKKIPSLIQTNGLAATFAFMYSKKGTYEVIYKQVEKWLKKRDFDINEELIKWIITQNSPEYRRVTNEVMGLFVWLRRFAEGMIEKDEDGEEKKE